MDDPRLKDVFIIYSYQNVFLNNVINDKHYDYEKIVFEFSILHWKGLKIMQSHPHITENALAAPDSWRKVCDCITHYKYKFNCLLKIYFK
jgi:hypothetical protein